MKLRSFFAAICLCSSIFVLVPERLFGLAFIGAEGFGANSVGGRGGRVIEVTNLDDSGAGSFRDAVETQSGARTVVFRVGGTIDAPDIIVISNGLLTIAAHTAPGDGIMFKGAPIVVENANEVIIRHLRIRPDHRTFNKLGLSVRGSSNDVIIDHCSIGWVDDDAYGIGSNAQNARNVTMQWGLISELFGSGNSSLIRQGTDYTFHHNLYIHAERRHPEHHSGNLDWVNNVTYNYSVGAQVLPNGSHDAQPNFVNNYHKHDAVAGSPPSTTLRGITMYGDRTRSATSSVYIEPNLGVSIAGNYEDEFDGTIVNMRVQQNVGGLTLVGSRFAYPQVTTTSAAQAVVDVLAKAGATVPVRDAIDTRMINDFNNRTGDHVTDNTGYPVYNSGPYPDSGNNGMSDEFELRMGVSNHNGLEIDQGMEGFNNGMTNLEYYLGELALDFPRLVGGPDPSRRLNFHIFLKRTSYEEPNGYAWNRVAPGVLALQPTYH